MTLVIVMTVTLCGWQWHCSYCLLAV